MAWSNPMRSLGMALVLTAALALTADQAAGSAIPAPEALSWALPAERADLSDPHSCGGNEFSRKLAELIAADPGQRRPILRCSALLSELASARAREMAESGRVRHVMNDLAPNTRLRRAGYELPRAYPRGRSNQVEAIAGGFGGPEEMWEAFKRSEQHRTHLLGEHPFFAEQDEIGVGFHTLKQSPHVEYWVVFVARRHSDEDGPERWMANREAPPSKK
jgi:hypothetical protein